MNGNIGIKGCNGKIGQWMVAKRFTRLLNKFPTLGFYFTMDFGLLVILRGSSCRKHRVS